jgi:hypothetical protein
VKDGRKRGGVGKEEKERGEEGEGETEDEKERRRKTEERDEVRHKMGVTNENCETCKKEEGLPYSFL